MNLAYPAVTSVAKLALPLLLLVACDQAPIAPPPTPQSSAQDALDVNTSQTEDDAPKVAVAPQRQEVQRENVTDGGNAHSDAPQGVKGRILLPSGEQAVGVQVMLLENAMNNPIDVFLKNKSGKVSPPLATAATAADGSFALGVRKAGQKVDLRILSDAHPELSRSPITVSAEDWIDIGDLKLEVGLTVQGRVVEAGTNLPVSEATVFLTPSARSHMMVATPGRERGVSVLTDQAGFFRFTSAPSTGTINLTAEAEGYASATELNQQISSTALNNFTLKIAAGNRITGVVVDPNGKRIPSAKVLAFGLSVKTPQNETVLTDEDGEFTFPSLRQGPYRLTTSASNYADNEIKVAVTGEDLTVVMEPRASVRLKVLSRQRRPVKSYRLSLKRAFPQNPDAIGNVMEFADRNVSPRDYDGDWAVIRNMPTGDFRFQIMEQNHAKSLSPMFQVVKGNQDVVEVVVELTEGATITGAVVDAYGAPVAGATVSSDMNQGLAAGTGLFEILKTMIPEKHTTRQVRTGEDGRFRISKLAFADYMVRVSHPKFCEGSAVDIKLTQEGQVIDVGVIELQLGTRVVGMTTINGAPAGQIKVVISMPQPEPGEIGAIQPGGKMTPAQRKATQQRLFSAHTLSDGNGYFGMLRRVPPGTYKITAARHSAENPFEALMDMKATERQLVIQPGQDEVTVNFDLQGR
ncbi:MAG: carboxypeptidase-like regulatory domain-containing protein [Planctomycetota bacterium]|nr:carboxypeptidase-like regulatory domain-containing protein [Planctomycetota bacterium]